MKEEVEKERWIIKDKEKKKLVKIQVHTRNNSIQFILSVEFALS